MKQILSVFLVALMMSACQSTSENKENTNDPSSISEIPTHNPAHGQPYHDCALAVGAPLVVEQPTTNTKEVKVNPEHGLPGHRCDLAVGAPLT